MARRKANLYDMLPLTSKKRAERKAKRKKTAGVAAGVAAGAAIGAAAGILLAPKSGKETREDIKMKTGEIATKVKDTTNRAVSAVKEKIAKPAKEEEVETVQVETVEE
ncbi:MAG: YtxH domain-containing protein [Clostridia bacterium]|mgnify:FL=1|jgi:gas vesicle protein|nr:YtxH domain-containing protein [Clostridia bacterium]